MGALGLLILGSIVVACILFLIQHLRQLGQLRSLNNNSHNNTNGRRRPKRILNPYEPMNEQQSLLENGIFPTRRSTPTKQTGGKWWLPMNQRRRRKQREADESLQGQRNSGRMLERVERGERRESITTTSGRGSPGSGGNSSSNRDDSFDSSLLAATFCRSSRVLKWHDQKAPFGFDLRVGKYSFVVSPVPYGRRRGDQTHGAIGRPKDVTATSNSSKDMPALLLSLLRLPRNRTVKSIAHDSEPFLAMADVAMNIRHP